MLHVTLDTAVRLMSDSAARRLVGAFRGRGQTAALPRDTPHD